MSLEFVNGLKNIKNIALLINEYHDDYNVYEKRKALNDEYHKLFEYNDKFNGVIKKYPNRIFVFNCRDQKCKPMNSFMIDENKFIFNPDNDDHIFKVIPRWYFEYTPWIYKY